MRVIRHVGTALVVAVLCFLLYLYADREVILAVANLPIWVRTLFKYVGKLGNGAWYVVPPLLVVFGVCVLEKRAPSDPRLPGLRLWRRRSLFLAGSVLGSGLLNMVPKMFFGRPRPVLFLGNGEYGFHFFQTAARMLSFPSGHANTAFAAATCIFLLRPRWGWFLFPAATLVALCRVMTAQHFPSDVLAGGYLGFLTVIALREVLVRRGSDLFKASPAGTAVLR
jgi:membrane-associated phospholipid phosphatase